MDKWEPPPANLLKLNIDVAMDSVARHRRIGFGWSSWPLVSKPKLNLTAAALSPHKSSTLGRLLAAAVLAAPVVAEASTAGEEDRSKRVRMRVSRGLGGGGGGCLASGESER
nr:hypothetical protein Iba_chr12cCG7760 [Ipomoea batatas]